MGQVNGTSLADAYAYLKDWYGSQGVDYSVARHNPTFALMEKDTEISGRVYPQPLAVGGSQDYVDFATAQTNQVPVNAVSFQVPTLQHYTLATVQNIVIQASRNDQGAFVKALKEATDIAMQNSILSDAWSMFRSGTGSIASLSTTLSAGVATLANPTDALAFQKGQVIVATSSDGGGTTRSGVGYVLGVSVNTGKVLFSATGQGGAAGNPSGWTTGDYLYPQSNINAQMNGISGWIVPPNNSSLLPVLGTPKVFLGVDRSQDPTRLAGTSLDLSGEDIEGGLIDLISQVKSIGRGQPDYTFVNPQSMRALTKALQARRSYVAASATTDAGITFSGCMVENSMVIQDPSCPPKTAFALDMPTWKMISFGKNPDFINYPDGLTGFRVSTADALEARIGGYRNVVCSDPSKNGVALLPQ